jgi:PAS domain S-box-containing protein
VTFIVSLAAAGLLGFWFSQIITTRIKGMSQAAAAIAGGDFEQRLPTGFIPDEVRDLAESYNSMAGRLGETFGALQESQRQISAVVESMAEGVVAFDAAGIVQVANPEAARLLACEGCELRGVSVDELTVPADVLEVARAGLAGNRAARTVEIGPHIALLHCTPLLDPDGGVDGAVLLLSDVTERHRLEDAQRRFVADASHEMRTPLAAIKGMLELLEDGAKDNPEVRDDFIHTMQLEADRLGRIVADLLTLARLEAGTLRLRVAAESAATLLGDVAGVLHTLAEDAGVTLALDLPEGDLRVMADHDRVVQVLLSFTDNAIKHSPRGSTIRLGASRRDGMVLLSVTDEGPGIEPEEVARVFERFYRADQARARRGGAGLGLAIAKEIVEAHGSQIEVTSAPGEGTSFGFELPAAPAGPAAEA